MRVGEAAGTNGDLNGFYRLSKSNKNRRKGASPINKKAKHCKLIKFVAGAGRDRNFSDSSLAWAHSGLYARKVWAVSESDIGRPDKKVRARWMELIWISQCWISDAQVPLRSSPVFQKTFKSKETFHNFRGQKALAVWIIKFWQKIEKLRQLPLQQSEKRPEPSRIRLRDEQNTGFGDLLPATSKFKVIHKWGTFEESHAESRRKRTYSFRWTAGVLR